MKLLFLFTFLVLLSCGTAKNSDATNNKQTNGLVIINENCLYIETTIEDETVRMYPVHLADEFKKSGLEISFDYALSKAQQPINCEVDRVVSLTNVSLSKK